MRAFLVLLGLVVLHHAAASPVRAQAEDPVRAVIDRLFDGMRAGDSTMVRASIHPEARFQTALVRNGRPALQTGSVDAFLEAVGTPHDEVWDERIWDVEIRVDGPLAQAWMQYAFFLSEELSHCGVNAMQLVDDGSGWRITQITDTRRSAGCEVPGSTPPTRDG